MKEKNITSLFHVTRCIVTDIFTYMAWYKNNVVPKREMQKVYRQSDFMFDLLVCYQGGEKVSQKKTLNPFDHTRTALENDRSIDREEHATISTPDLLALVQLGKICENVCATIESWSILPLPSQWTAFSFKSSFDQERMFLSWKITHIVAHFRISGRHSACEF